MSYKDEGRKIAFKVCEALREQGLVVELDVTRSEMVDLKQYAITKGIGGIINIVDEQCIEVHNIEKNETSTVTIDELLGR
jgi:ATP phosphoribosyltransferase regulatory subunit